MNALAVMRRGLAGRGRLTGTDAWSTAVPVVATSIAAILLLFSADVADIVTIWWTSSTFEHCLVVLPIVAWLVWQRRTALVGFVPRGWAPGLSIVAVGAVGWMLGQAAGVALARHLGILLMIQGAVVATLGPTVARGLLFPLGYMVFLVPAGEGLVEPLQALTARMSMALLHLWEIPARLDGVFITTPAGWFEVAEACSGAKFLIAMVALGALVANLCFRTVRRRLLFMIAAVTVPVLANGLRAFGTILVAQYRGIQAADGFDHVVYGWFFFGIVIALLLGISWRWFDRAAADPAFDPARLEPVPPGSNPRAIPVMAALAVLIAALPLAWTGATTRGGRLAPAPASIAAPAGWATVGRTSGLPWAPAFPGADRASLSRYRDTRGDEVDLAVAAYGDQSEGHEIVGYGIGAVTPDSGWNRASDGAAVTNGRAIRIIGPGDTSRDVVIFYRIGNVTTGSEARVKLETLRTRLMGGSQHAAAILISAEAPRGGTARPVIDRFLAAIGPVDILADAAVR